MTKHDLIEAVAAHYPHFSSRQVERIVNAVFASMTEALAQGQRIELRGFGSFGIRHRRARAGRNPKSGVPLTVAAKQVPWFKVSQELRGRVSGPEAPAPTGAPEQDAHAASPALPPHKAA
jgi:integration host factor subunit beta